MTTLYKNHMTIATPQHLIEAANHLALIMGESAADINTFTAANYQDSAGNLYAVCSTVVTDGVGSAMLSITLPPSARSASTSMAPGTCRLAGAGGCAVVAVVGLAVGLSSAVSM